MSDYLTLDDLAKRWGLNYTTLVMRRNRGQLPEPDKTFGRSPVWLEETIEDYERKENGQRAD